MKSIFAYGSLINEHDLKRTVPDAVNFRPAKLYGYRREFNVISTYRFDPKSGAPICVLNLKKTDNNAFLNGVCFEMNDMSFGQLLVREKGYDMIAQDLYEYGSDNFLCEGSFFISTRNRPYPFMLDSSLQFDYLSTCIEGCRRYGKEFVDDFKKTTSFFGLDKTTYDSLVWDKITT